MSISRIHISPQIIESPQAMRQFFDSSPDVKKVIKLAGKPPYDPPREHGLKAIAYIAGFIFFSAIYGLSKLIGARNLVLRTELLINHCTYGLGELIPSSQTLIPLRNCVRFDASDFYLSPSLKTPSGLFNPSRLDGHCGGITLWFNYLYLKTRSAFSSAESQIRAVSKRFRKGAPIHAAFIQCYLKMVTGQKFFKDLPKTLHMKYRSRRLIEYKEPNDIEKIAQKIFSLRQGCYCMTLHAHNRPGHAISFVRNKEERFFIDPNFGAIRISTSKDLELLVERYLTIKNRTKSSIAELLTPQLKPKGIILIQKATLIR